MTSQASQELQNILFTKIKDSVHQRVTFAEYMELALYDSQYGYYNSGVVGIGAKGDFFTSSSLGKDFGELLAIQFQEMWTNLGCPQSFSIVEMGAGNGELAQDILNHIRESDNLSFAKALRYIIIEESKALIKVQQALLIPRNFNNLNWQNWSDISGKSIVGCFFSNELVDSFSVHRITKNQHQFQEIYLELTQNRLVETIHPPSTERLSQYFDLIGIDLLARQYPQDYRTEVNLNALDWLETMAAKLKQGYVLTIDYGYNAEKYYRPSRNQGTLQCYYQHRRHSNPYVNLGRQDITAHVDFTALQLQGNSCDLKTIGFTQQALFLMALGLGDRLNDLSSGKYNITEIFQRRDALHQLIDPTGLGGFGVLIQGKNLTESAKSLKGLVIPDW